MKQVHMVLPPLASDTAGAASALFSLGGLTVLHDAAGSLESYITFDEPRELDGRRTVASRLSRLDAITGDDGVLLEKLTAECAAAPPPFVALLGSPVPFVIGTDLEGIAAEAEFAAGVSAFAVKTSGFSTYDKGGGEALRAALERLTHAPRPGSERRINLLGATPMDFSEAEVEGMRQQLRSRSEDRVCTLTMTEDLEEIRCAAEAERSVVISTAGLPAARYLHRQYGVPYSVGIPIREKVLSGWNPSAAYTVLVLGEAVFSKQLTCILQKQGISAVAGMTAGGDPEIFPEVAGNCLDTEDAIRKELQKEYFAVVGDPLYRLLLPQESKTIFFARPHRAISGRLYQAQQKTLNQLLTEMKEVLK